MITRRHMRRWLVWAGVGVGVLGLVGFVLSPLGKVVHEWGVRRIEVGRGGIALYWAASPPITPQVARAIPDEDGGQWIWVPWYGERESPFQTFHYGRLMMPYWVLVLVGAAAAYRLLPADSPRGRCRKCGYDLTGVPGDVGSLRCPECGESSAPAGRS